MAWSRWLRCTCTIILTLHVASRSVQQDTAVKTSRLLNHAVFPGTKQTGSEVTAVASSQSNTPAKTSKATDARDAVPRETSLGLALPGKHHAASKQSHSSVSASAFAAEVDYIYTDAYDGSYEPTLDYVYLEGDLPVYKLPHPANNEHVDPAGSIAQEPTKPASPGQLAGSASSDSALMSQLPTGFVLQQSFAQQIAALASDVAQMAWQAMKGVEAAAQQTALASPLKMQELGNVASTTAVNKAASGTTNAGNGETVEVSVTVENSRPRHFFPLLLRQEQKKAAAADSLEAATIAAAVLKALGLRGNKQLEASGEMQDIVQNIKQKGSYEGELELSNDRLSQTTTAAVIAATEALADDSWDSMEMEIEVTHSVQNHGLTWFHVTLIVIATAVTHIGLCMLIAPWLSKLRSSGDCQESSSLKPQFITSGLEEAGLYQKLLPEP